MKKALVFFSVLGLAACGGGGSSPSSPSPTPTPFVMSGNYAGTVQDSVCGNGAVQMSAVETDTSVSGTWAAQWPNCGSNAGQLSATVQGQALSAKLTPSDPTTCPFNLTGVLSGGGAAVSGTYASYNCTTVISGTFSMTRQ